MVKAADMYLLNSSNISMMLQMGLMFRVFANGPADQALICDFYTFK